MNKIEYIKKYISLRNLYDQDMDEYILITDNMFEVTEISNEDKLEILTFGFIDSPKGANSSPIQGLSGAFEYYLALCNVNYIVIFSENFNPHAKEEYYYQLRGCLSLNFEKNKEKLFTELKKVFDPSVHTLFIETLKLQANENGEEWTQNSQELLKYLNIIN